MLQNDNDIIKALGFVALYSAYLEEQIDDLLFMFDEIEKFSEDEQRWSISRKLKKAKLIASNFDFEGRDALVTHLDLCKRLFEERNKVVHGRIYANFKRPATLRSGRPQTPDREIDAAELYNLANAFETLVGEIYRPMIFKIPRALASCT